MYKPIYVKSLNLVRGIFCINHQQMVHDRKVPISAIQFKAAGPDSLMTTQTTYKLFQYKQFNVTWGN
jgi:hypothetical protein